MKLVLTRGRVVSVLLFAAIVSIAGGCSGDHGVQTVPTSTAVGTEHPAEKNGVRMRDLNAEPGGGARAEGVTPVAERPYADKVLHQFSPPSQASRYFGVTHLTHQLFSQYVESNGMDWWWHTTSGSEASVYVQQCCW